MSSFNGRKKSLKTCDYTKQSVTTAVLSIISDGSLLGAAK